MEGHFLDWWWGGAGQAPGPSAPNYGRELCRTSTVMVERACVSAIEMWLIRLAYEDMVRELSCRKCGAPLGRQLRFVRPADCNPPSWRVLAVTRCSGWRRHRYIARVSESSKDLFFGLFQLS